MGKTIVEKIFTNKTGKDLVAGDTAFAPVDLIMGTDGTVPLSIEIFKEFNTDKVKDPSRLFFVNDHFVPAKDIAAAELSKRMREFAREQHVEQYYEVGRSGICHIIVPDSGKVLPGHIVVGADSHTVTYGALGAFSTGIGSTDMACAWATGELWFKVPETIKIIANGRFKPNVSAKDLILHIIGELGVEGASYDAIEFEGQAIEEMDMAGRFTLCNMVVEMGAKSGFVKPDGVTHEYFKGLGIDIALDVFADSDAAYKRVIEINVNEIDPTIACPYDPSQIKPVGELIGTRIDQVVIGSCTNGRIEDFRVAHHILKNKQVYGETRLILIPGSQKVLQGMIEEQMLDDFIRAGAIIGPPTCGPCIGGHMGVLASGEVGLFTTNRNFYGRNGHPESTVYLCSPAIAAYSAVKGEIASS